MVGNRWHLKEKGKRLPVKKALRWIILSTLLISGSAAFVLLYTSHVREIQRREDRFNIITIEQSGMLSTDYIAELLGLSVDHPVNLFKFSLDEAKNRLLSSSLIHEVKITKIKPHTLSVKYKCTYPIACLQDFTNTGIDREGSLLSLEPFFEANEFPELHLGGMQDEIRWGDRMDSDRFRLALKVMNIAEEGWAPEGLILKKIDVSKAESQSYGSREVVVHCEQSHPIQNCPMILRLNVENIRQQLADFEVLRKSQTFKEYPQLTETEDPIIDLRIPSLAFIYSNQ